MYKFKFLVLGLVFFIACKNDQKVDTTLTSNETENGVSENQTTTSAAGGNVAQNNVSNDGNATTNTSLPQAENVINNAGNNAAASTPTTTNQATEGQKPNTKNGGSVYDPKPIYGKPKNSETYTTILPDENKAISKDAKLSIPDPCSLISSSTLVNVFDLKNEPQIKSGSKPQAGATDKSCFFRFEGDPKPNAGIMLQVMINPLPGEIDDYPSLVIDGKIKDGEMSPVEKTPKKFKVWNEVGDGGCYSFSAGKYHWKIGKKYVFMLAFNTSHTEAQQKQIAAAIGKEVMKNFINKN